MGSKCEVVGGVLPKKWKELTMSTWNGDVNYEPLSRWLAKPFANGFPSAGHRSDPFDSAARCLYKSLAITYILLENHMLVSSIKSDGMESHLTGEPDGPDCYYWHSGSIPEREKNNPSDIRLKIIHPIGSNRWHHLMIF